MPEKETPSPRESGLEGDKHETMFISNDVVDVLRNLKQLVDRTDLSDEEKDKAVKDANDLLATLEKAGAVKEFKAEKK